MKAIKNFAFTALLALGAFGMVTYTACTKDECKDVVCNNGGTCAGGACSCPAGYEGNSCETLTRSKFVGTWKGTDVCGSGTYTITLTINTSTNDVQALVSNPGGFGTNITITGTVETNSTIRFTGANVGGQRTLSGVMTFSGGTTTTLPNAMQFVYTVTPATGAADQCTGTYLRQ